MLFVFPILCCLFHRLPLYWFSWLQVTEKNNANGLKQNQNMFALITEKSEDRAGLQWYHWNPTTLSHLCSPQCWLNFQRLLSLVVTRCFHASSSSRPHSSLLERSNYPFPRIPSKNLIELYWLSWDNVPIPKPIIMIKEKKKPYSIWLPRLSHMPIPYHHFMNWEKKVGDPSEGNCAMVTSRGNGGWVTKQQMSIIHM